MSRVKSVRCLIPQLLHDRGWKQQDLADKTGLDKRIISFYCTNTRNRMTLATAVVIADILRVSPRDLYEWSYVDG